MFAAAGSAVFLMGKHRPLTLHSTIAGRITIVQTAPEIANVLSQLIELGDKESMDAILELVEQILAMDKAQSPAGQWYISRSIGDIEKIAYRMCDNIPSLSCNDTYRRTLIAKDELIPQLMSLLDGILHNNILDNAFV